jgi:hypothetical protein
LAALTVLTLGIACLTSPAGENAGAGTLRDWTGVNGAEQATIKARYVKTENGVVVLNWTRKVQVQEPAKTTINGKKRTVTTNFKTLSKDMTSVVRVPLARLAEADRKWVEATDPEGTCLTRKSAKGVVGTLTPHSGQYEVRQVIDKQNAVVDYRVDGKTQWTFWLRSEVVKDLNKGGAYSTIPAKAAKPSPPPTPPATSKKQKHSTQADQASKIAEHIGGDFRRAGSKWYDERSLAVIEDNL